MTFAAWVVVPKRDGDMLLTCLRADLNKAFSAKRLVQNTHAVRAVTGAVTDLIGWTVDSVRICAFLDIKLRHACNGCEAAHGIIETVGRHPNANA